MPRHVDAAARRTALIAAVWEVAASDGLEAVTARSVAARAGLSLGAVTRTYPRQEELHVAAMTAVVERVQQRLADQVLTGDVLDDAAWQLEQVLPLAPETRAEALVFYAYLARARTSPELRPVADAVDEALAAMCEQAVAALAPGSPPARQELRARELHALTEGLAFGLATWPGRRDAEQARAVLRAWLAAIDQRRSTAVPPT